MEAERLPGKSIICGCPLRTAAISVASTAPIGRNGRNCPAGEILSYEELLRVAGVAAEMGIRKIRITGGEPLVRRGVVGFLQNLNRVPGIEEVCLTTNGVLLPELAPAIYERACATSISVWTP